VAFGEQDTGDRKQRIDMARSGRRSEKNFHDTGPLIADTARIRGSPNGRDALRRIIRLAAKPTERSARCASRATGKFQGLDIALRL
jgi:hypothetical protein